MLRYYVKGQLFWNTDRYILSLVDTLGPYPAEWQQPMKRRSDGTYQLNLLVDDPVWERLLDSYCRMTRMEIIRKERVEESIPDNGTTSTTLDIQP